MSATSTILLVFLFIWPIMSFVPFLQTLVTRALSLHDPSSPSSSSSPSNMSQSQSPSAPHAAGEANRSQEPSAMDVVVVKMMLQQGLKLPPEVVLSVLDFAEYWPHTTAVMDRPQSVPSGKPGENRFILRSKPLGFIKKTHYDDDFYTFTPVAPVSPEPLSSDAEYPPSQFQDWIGGPTNVVQHPCRKIVFTITSHDQGWSSARHERGSYQASYTWFEAGLERFDRNALRPKDATEIESSRTHESVTDEAEAGPSAAAAEASEKNTEDAATTSVEHDDLPEPYLPLYSLRSIYPSVEPDRPEFHHDLLPSPQFTIQRNKTATRMDTTHRIVWSWTDHVNAPTAEKLDVDGRGRETGDGAFVRDLKLGDVVTVWAKTRFASWVNHVESVKLDVYWAL